MKDERLNIVLSKQLYEKVKEEAAKHNVSMAHFVRATLAHSIFGSQKSEKYEGYVAIDPDGAYIFDL